MAIEWIGLGGEGMSLIDRAIAQSNAKAYTDSKLSLLDWELQNKQRSTKPIFTFIDDDGHADVLTTILPISQQYGIPFVVAAIGKSITDGITGRMGLDDLLMLQNMGWEISSHTYNHPLSPRLQDLTEEQQDYELKHAKEVFEAAGIKITTVCYPGSSHNDTTVSLAQKYYRCGRTTDYGINKSPLQTWDLMVINGEGKTHTLESLKTDIDKIKTEGGWGIYVTHTYMMDDTQKQLFRDIVDYVVSEGIEVVTLNEGLNRMGNIIDTGRHWDNDYTKPHFVLGADGNMRSDKICFTDLVTDGKVVNSTPPSFFAHKKITVARIRSSDSAGFPHNLAGTLTTHREAAGTSTEWSFIYQQFVPYTTSDIYVRHAVSMDEWSEWRLVNTINVLPVDTITPTTSPMVYGTPLSAGTITVCMISASGAIGFPENTAGILTTWKLTKGNYIYQEYEVGGTLTKYRRRWTVGTSEWSPWLRITPIAATTTQRNAASFIKNPGDMVFDTTLGKPIWRNAANDGWVDATGAAV